MSEVLALLEQVGPASATAAGVALVLVLVCGLPWSGNRIALKSAGWVLGIGLGFYVGCWTLGFQFEWMANTTSDGFLPRLHWPLHWPPSQDRDRFLLVLLPAVIVVELLATLLRVRPALVWPMRLILAALTARILLHNSIYLVGPGENQWSLVDAWMHLAALGGLLAVVWLLLSTLAQRAPNRALPVTLALTCAAAGVTIMLSGNVSGGLLAFPLAGALLGAAIASFMVGTAGVPFCVGIGVVGLFAPLLGGHFFSELTTAHALLLFLAPLLCWLPEIPVVRKMPAPLRGLTCVALILVPLGFVATEARQKFIEDSRPRSTISPAGTEIPEASVDDYRNFGN